MRMPGIGELIIIFAIIMLVFGANKLPQLGAGIGKAIKNFKRGINHDDDDLEVMGTSLRVEADSSASKPVKARLASEAVEHAS